MSEIYYTCLLVWAVFFVVGRDSVLRWLAGGLLFGLSTLTKTQTLIFPVFLFGFTLFLDIVYDGKVNFGPSLRQISLKIILVYLAMLFVILPWTWRNYQVFNEFVLVSTNAGRTLLAENHPNATGDHFPNINPLENEITIPWEERVARQVEYDKMARRIVFDWIRDNPGMYLALAPRKIFRLWALDGEGEWGYQAGHPNYESHKLAFRSVRYFNQAYYMIILGLCFVTFLSAFYERRRADKSLQCLAYPIFISIISIVFHGDPRYHFAAMPFLLILAAMTLKRIVFRGGDHSP